MIETTYSPTNLLLTNLDTEYLGSNLESIWGQYLGSNLDYFIKFFRAWEKLGQYLGSNLDYFIKFFRAWEKLGMSKGRVIGGCHYSMV